MAHCVMDARRLRCPQEFALASNIPIHQMGTWLSLMRRIQTQHDSCFTPSPEEMSIMVNTHESWADVVS